MKKQPTYNYKTKAVAAAALGITPTVLDVIGNAAYAVYQEIGADLSALNDGKLMRRAEVIETVLDASRTEQRLVRDLEDQVRRNGPNAAQRIADLDAALKSLRERSVPDYYSKLTGAMKLYFSYAMYE